MGRKRQQDAKDVPVATDTKKKRDTNAELAVTTAAKKKKLDTSEDTSAEPTVPQKLYVVSEKPKVTTEEQNGAVGGAEVGNGAKRKASTKKHVATAQKPSVPVELDISNSVPDAEEHAQLNAATMLETDSSSQENPKRTFRRTKNYCLEPHGKSWLIHISNLAVHRFVTRLVSHGVDPRDHPEGICTIQDIFSDEDKKLIWHYISKQYPDASLQSILKEFSQYANLTEKDLIARDIQAKYKDVIPRPPLSSYIVFVQRKMPSLKKKYPDLKPTELTQKLGQKWKSLVPAEKEKYKTNYDLQKEEYKQQLEQFYTEHPDAKVALQQISKSAKTSSVDAHTKELRKLVPKCVKSACAVFCQERQKSMQEKRPDLKIKDITVCLRSKWVKLSSEEKSIYVKKFEEMKSAYQHEMKKFIEEHPDAEELLKTNKSTKNAKTSQKPSKETHHGESAGGSGRKSSDAASGKVQMSGVTIQADEHDESDDNGECDEIDIEHSDEDSN